MTPVGEPLGTIAIAALHADFWYLVRLLGWLVVAGILIVGIVSLIFPVRHGESLKAERDEQTGWKWLSVPARYTCSWPAWWDCRGD